MEQYRHEVLQPKLGVRQLGALLREHGKRRAFSAQSDCGGLILKFYFGKTTDARNAVEAQGLLEARGIPLAPLVHADASDETLEKYGLACIAYERIDGKPLAIESDGACAPDPTAQIARMLARMHLDIAPKANATPPADRERRREPESLDLNLKRIAQIPLAGSGDLASALRSYFDLAAQPGSALGGLSLVHNDFSPHNLLLRPDGGFVLLDLDLCARGTYGIELAHALVRFSPAIHAGQAPRYPLSYLQGDRSAVAPFIEAYMGEAGPAFRDDWNRWDRYYILWDLVDAVATTAADLSSGKETSGAGRKVARQIEKQFGLLGKCLEATRSAVE